MRYAFVFIAVFVACLGGFDARAQEAPGFDHAGLARQVLERHILPGYEAVREAATKLEEQTGAFCAAPPGDVGALGQTFAQAVFAWSRIEHVRFGPVMDEQRHARLFYWPDRKALGWRQVKRALASRDESVLTPESLRDKSVALQGLGAFEQILHGGGHEELAQAGAAWEFRCAFMQSIAANIAHIAEEVIAAWTGKGGYSETFLNPGPENRAYLEPSEATLEISKAFIAGLEQLRDYRIAGPLGLQQGSTRKRPAAFARSGLSTRAIAANLEGLVAFYTRGGLKERIGAHESGMGEAILNDLEQSLGLLKSIEAPMEQAVEDEKTEDRLMAVGFPLRNAREQAARVLADAAGLSLGFNALDGD